MIEHEQLMKYATDEDDYPVWFCLCQNDVQIDWKENNPDEILSVPEKLFNNLGKLFIDEIGLKYYDTVIISNDLEALLLKSFIVADNTERNLVAAREITKFIEKAKSFKETHYLTFEGP